MKRHLFTILSAVSLVLLLADAFLQWKSSLVRDEISFARRSKFVVASDSGRIEFVFATCSTGTVAPIGGAIGLIKGSPTAYSQRFEVQWKSMLPGDSGNITLGHVGSQTSTIYTYGSLFGSGDLGTSPLVNDVSAVTIPNSALLFLFAVAPGVWLWKLWRRRHQ